MPAASCRAAYRLLSSITPRSPMRRRAGSAEQRPEIRCGVHIPSYGIRAGFRKRFLNPARAGLANRSGRAVAVPCGGRRGGESAGGMATVRGRRKGFYPTGGFMIGARRKRGRRRRPALAPLSMPLIISTKVKPMAMTGNGINSAAVGRRAGPALPTLRWQPEFYARRPSLAIGVIAPTGYAAIGADSTSMLTAGTCGVLGPGYCHRRWR